MRRFPVPAMLPGLLFLLLLSQQSHATKGLNPDGSLDKATLSKAYFEGEFWTVITALEAYRKNGLASGTRDDSVYTYKYLSVVYAAEPSTRQKAESYMYLLLKMMPTIDLLDLYISDNIEAIFQKVRSDFDRIQKLNGSVSEAAKLDGPTPAVAGEAEVVAPVADSSAQVMPAAAAARPLEEPRRRKIRPWVWAALGGGVVASVTTFVLLSDSDDPSAPPSRTWEPTFNLPQP